MLSMTSHPKHRNRSSLTAWAVGGCVLGLGISLYFSSQPAHAAGAMARASATVMAPVTVSSFLGAPVTVRDLLAAWHASAAGPQTGAGPIRLPSLLPLPTEQEQRQAELDSQTQEQLNAWSDAQRAQPSNTGLLQTGLAAAITALGQPGGEGDGGLLFITVAFN